MGLDMYINRVKKVGNLTLKEIQDIASYIDWKKNGSQYSFEEWCYGDKNKVKTEYEDDVRKLVHIQKHPAWAWGDYENTYEDIKDNVAYWRKANQIHNWFVKNVQNGIDDCGDYLLTKEDVEELLHTTKLVLDSCKLIDGKVVNGYHFENGKEVPMLEDGKVIVDTNVAEELLPSTSGFFFGGTDYDQWYYEDLVNTVEQLEKILEETDFDKEYLFYHSSW